MAKTGQHPVTAPGPLGGGGSGHPTANVRPRNRHVGVPNGRPRGPLRSVGLLVCERLPYRTDTGKETGNAEE